MIVSNFRIEEQPMSTLFKLEDRCINMQDKYITMVKGDTLGGIARKFYGRASAWKKIQEANTDRMRGKDKTVIVPGMKLQIPRP